jgi:hypothetical protein
MRPMRFGVRISALLVFGVLLSSAGCGSNSPATGGLPHDGSAGNERGVDAPADVPVTGAGGQAGAAVGDAAAGTGGANADAAHDGVGGVSGDAALETAGEVPSGSVDARVDGTAGDSVDGTGTDGGGEPVSMPCMAAGACDPFDPTSCGAKLCAVGGDGNTSCITAAATLKGLGATCTTREQCAGGLDCVIIGADPAATCQRMCPRGSIGFCGGEYRCTSLLAGCVQYCRLRDVPCDIYAQDCAAAGTACSLSVDSETGARYTGCRSAGTAARGDRCETATCGKGLLCVREGSVSTCRQICTGDGGAAPCLAAGETCSGLTSTYQIAYCR